MYASRRRPSLIHFYPSRYSAGGGRDQKSPAWAEALTSPRPRRRRRRAAPSEQTVHPIQRPSDRPASATGTTHQHVSRMAGRRLRFEERAVREDAGPEVAPEGDEQLPRERDDADAPHPGAAGRVPALVPLTPRALRLSADPSRSRLAVPGYSTCAPTFGMDHPTGRSPMPTGVDRGRGFARFWRAVEVVARLGSASARAAGAAQLPSTRRHARSLGRSCVTLSFEVSSGVGWGRSSTD